MSKTLTASQKDAINRMTAHVLGRVTAIDVEQRLRDELDDTYDFSAIGGPFANMAPSNVLEEMDPIAFRCMVADMSPDDTMYEINGDCYDRREVDEAAEEFIDELRDELDAASEEIADDDDPDESEVKRIEADIEACEGHSW